VSLEGGVVFSAEGDPVTVARTFAPGTRAPLCSDVTDGFFARLSVCNETRKHFNSSSSNLKKMQSVLY
jgi:hypothetical protein